MTENMPKLVISGTTHELVEDLITIGRGPDNGIVINDPSVSTHHAELQRAGETYRSMASQSRKRDSASTIEFDLERLKPAMKQK